jgi:hypothetical protein
MNELTDILQASPPIALAIALNLLGLAWKKMPVANWMIPIVLPLIGAVVFPFIAERGKINFECQNPAILLGVYGFAIGAASVGLNQMLRQFIGRKNGTGETEFLKKQDIPK